MRTIAISLLLAACSLCTATALHARTLEEIQQDGTILLATDDSYPPFSFLHAGHLTGYEVEVAQAVVQKMGLKWEWKVSNFEAALPGLAQNHWDLVIASHAITPERAKTVAFAAPHYCSGGQIISLNPTISKVADLKGKVVAAQTASTYFEAAGKVPGIKEVKPFVTEQLALDALLHRRVDAWVADRFIAKKMHSEGSLLGFRAGQMLFVERIAAAVAKDNVGLLQAWNSALQALMADGSIAALSQKYFKEDVTCK